MSNVFVYEIQWTVQKTASQMLGLLMLEDIVACPKHTKMCYWWESEDIYPFAQHPHYI